MHCESVKEANEHWNTAATRTFTWALEAEKTHAIALVETGRTCPGWTPHAILCVCAACEYISASPDEIELCVQSVLG
jgi:hypothetical protein